mmetsp:Transcript_36946/g.96760  ORF Transcript_36946/g.96760 Transcript_36946/m.96760 type:complete len:517 (-) Transcript_36946:1526-3076(-)
MRRPAAGEFDFGVTTTLCGGVAASGACCCGDSVTTLVGLCCRRAGLRRPRIADPGVLTPRGVVAPNSVKGLPTAGDACGVPTILWLSGLFSIPGTNVTTVVGLCCRRDWDLRALRVAGVVVGAIFGVVLLLSLAASGLGCTTRALSWRFRADRGKLAMTLDAGAAAAAAAGAVEPSSGCTVPSSIPCPASPASPASAASTIASPSSASISTTTGIVKASSDWTLLCSILCPAAPVSPASAASTMTSPPSTSISALVVIGSAAAAIELGTKPVLTIFLPTRGGVFSARLSWRLAPVWSVAPILSWPFAAAGWPAADASPMEPPSCCSAESPSGPSSSNGGAFKDCINETLIVTSPEESRSTGAPPSVSCKASSAKDNFWGAAGSGSGSSSTFHWIPFFFVLFFVVPDLIIELGGGFCEPGAGCTSTTGVRGDSGDSASGFALPMRLTSPDVDKLPLSIADASATARSPRGVGNTSTALLGPRRRDGVTGGPRKSVEAFGSTAFSAVSSLSNSGGANR